MPLIHHTVRGDGDLPLVFVHGFGCSHSDWDAQVAHFAPRHRTVAVDLRGHGDSAGAVEDCSIERYGADVAEVMRALALPPSVVVGHSMGCRVAIEAALQAPRFVRAVVLVDGSQFSPAMEDVLRQRFAEPGGYAAVIVGTFATMFSPRSDAATAAAVKARAARLPADVGTRMMTDMQRYDVTRLEASLASLRVPLLVVQCTYADAQRQRQSLAVGQTSPYLDMVRARVPGVRVEIIPDCGHFPQWEAAAALHGAMAGFVATLATAGWRGRQETIERPASPPGSSVA